MKTFGAYFLILAAFSSMSFAQNRDLDANTFSPDDANEELLRQEKFDESFGVKYKSRYFIDESGINESPDKKVEVQSVPKQAEVTAFETLQSCGIDRNYMEKQVQDVANIYKLIRKDQDSESKSNVPQQCITFIMKKFFEPALTTPKRMFANCTRAAGRPEEDLDSRDEFQPRIDALKRQLANGQLSEEQRQEVEKNIRTLEAQVKHKHYMQPCVTETYAQTVYNSFTDIANCFNIPQKEILPKFFNESGFHINAYGAGKDAGVGQLTGEAIKAVLPRLPYYIGEMKKSEKASCRRVSEQASAFASIDSDLFDRCNLMASPENPLRNLFYTAVFYKESVRYVAGITYRAGSDLVIRNDGTEVPLENKVDEELGGALERNQIREKFSKLKFKAVNLHRLKTMVVSLGYNSGAVTAMNRLNDYLNERLQHFSVDKNLTLSAKNFDFENTDVRKIRKAIMPPLMKKEFTEAETKEIEAQDVLRKRSLPEIYAKAYRLSFPEFLVLRTNSGPRGREPYQLYGFPGYLSALALKNKILTSQFSNGECSSNNYLNLAK